MIKEKRNWSVKEDCSLPDLIKAYNSLANAIYAVCESLVPTLEKGRDENINIHNELNKIWETINHGKFIA